MQGIVTENDTNSRGTSPLPLTLANPPLSPPPLLRLPPLPRSAMYQFQGLGDDQEEVEVIGDHPYFTPHNPLVNLLLMDSLESLSPVTEMKACLASRRGAVHSPVLTLP